MTSIYHHLGVDTIINAKGTATRLSGGTMPPEVAAAMQEATQYCVDMTELQGRASEIIAGITGAEAGCVTSGAAAGLLLGTAACVTGLDPGKMNRLPDTRGMRNEVIVVRSQRNFYDHAVRATGIKLIEVGLADRYSGAGVRDAEVWEVADAISERTACIFYVAAAQSQPALPELTRMAHQHGVPVLVDAAAQLPPVSNLKRFIEEGADLLVFSGGKAIAGPQGSGILCGRKALVAAALLQTLDHDILPQQWHPPAALFADIELRGLPQHGIGRSCKVGKEQIIGLLVALQRFVKHDHVQQNGVWRDWLEQLRAELALGESVGVRLAIVEQPNGLPCLEVALLQAPAADAALQLILALEQGRPSIRTDPSRVHQGKIMINPSCLQHSDIALIAARLKQLLQQI